VIAILRLYFKKRLHRGRSKSTIEKNRACLSFPEKQQPNKPVSVFKYPRVGRCLFDGVLSRFLFSLFLFQTVLVATSVGRQYGVTDQGAFQGTVKNVTWDWASMRWKEKIE